MIAGVIVDVPAFGTDKTFDYRIPEHLEETIEVGMRVVVPFGPRKLTGFVIGLKETSDLKRLKKIEDIVDPSPVLNQELIGLGKWIANSTLCFLHSAYQSMLPAAMKMNYSKRIYSINEAIELPDLPEQIRIQLDSDKGLDWAEAQKSGKHIVRSIQSAIHNGNLEVKYEIRSKGKKKRHKVVMVNIPTMELNAIYDDISRKAPKQAEVIRYFIGNNETKIPTQKLMDETESSRATIKSLIDKQILLETEEEIYRDPYKDRQFERTVSLTLTEEQKESIKPILSDIENNQHETFLIHGVTGSGKTEIYLQSIEAVIQKGKEAIMLVPEISLTPQMVHRFKGRFGSEVAVLHSGLSVGEKYDEWRKIQRKEAKVVVGARSAIFAPFQNIGIIIIDEEHESSYKQEENPRYHARDIAIERGRFHQCPVVLGSATPTLESYARAKKGVYTLCTLHERVNQKALPTAEVVDMREELRSGNRSLFSTALFDRLKDRVDKGEQSVLLLNRRGYSTFVNCRDCGYVAQCPHCDISLTYHKRSNQLKCHYCGFEDKQPTECPECTSEHIRFFGTGTQKVEEELNKLMPEASVIRMDVDTTSRKGMHEKLLNAFAEQKADILLGTQMIAKGLDFPNVTLVGVLAADSMLHLPDFRSAERTFQLLTQVGGRAGRHILSGEVVIQTYTPEHYSIQLAQQHDFLTFYDKEMLMRKLHQYPPFYFLTLVTISHEELMYVVDVCEKITEVLKEGLSEQAVILGPVASPIPRVKDRYRYQCVIKYKNEPTLKNILNEILAHYQKRMQQDQLTINIDMHPQTIL
ncbi:primosomal protein N' [Pseudalkalibacillus berkeleyi]|uniref:Replication restart protein PriA n=1 Tax=Pseudalkalibacillus berkeleyi TaxID=1069813 RepID=A0ABS9GW75_9BACL|nr:primosomal protein N' [Pseudalkalibacillus berkeleyi]MCF6137053.1 primosomal protein N' [Pseudalkalibacillus berkeleyi]